MRILAIETSCDETAIAIIECSGSKKRPEILVLSNLVSSQAKLHAKFGGVVPNLAKREHEKNLTPLLLQALNESRIMSRESRKIKNKFLHNSLCKIRDSILNREPALLKQFEKEIMPLPIPPIDVIAVTHGPGLAPALWVGVNFARALAILWKKPIIPVNHMEGHLYSPLLEPHKANLRVLEFPALSLLVSGGHTELVLIKKFGQYQIIGETLDDAAGEAFDKVARMLGLGYPGGPAISALAGKKFKSLKFKVILPRPMLHSKDFNFSFSGLKTAVKYLLRDIYETGSRRISNIRPVIAEEFQKAVVDILVSKTIRAAKEYNVKTILLGGGVAANQELRKRISEEVLKHAPAYSLRLPDSNITGDNALMIALAAYIAGKKKAMNNVRAEANLRLS
ncbi:MAG: tRNA (adenosine(37)-N6)-threonylcarbamoyltransferase complex transferase subunit TsaD [Candidatus Sungbacteria bacterium]|nr:tRNA (adenosine(37)-N6)-threonylcarbamoyltransferase complex transferase subunit TsaD [Candidatus Sungbacteria bacterium]